MKKIYNILLAAVAMLAFTPLMSAQDIPFPADNKIKFSSDEWNKQYEIDTQSGVAYRKIISKPNSQGIYHIMLDAFVTGREIKINQAVRADIVLVLDVSTSMNRDMNGNTTNVDANRRITALKNAVATFVDLIDQNDTENAPEGSSRLGNRIAIVPFGSSLSTSGSNQVRNFRGLGQAATIKQNVQDLTIPQNNGTNAHLGMERALTLLQGSTAQIRTVVLFTDGNPGYTGEWDGANGYQQLDAQYGGGRAYQNTLNSANNTINYASQIKALSHDDEDPTKRVIANVFTVSVINNPQPYTDVYLGKTSSNWKSDATSMGTYTLSRSGSSWTGYTYTVSGWNTTDIWANGNGTRNKTKDGADETKYAITASNAAQLEAAFATIAQDTGGSSENLGEASVSTVDVVSASFTMPTGTTANSIRVYTAPCTSVATSGQPSFGTMIQAKDRTDTYQPMKKENGVLVPDGNPKDVDDQITTGLEGNKITVNGFDFSNLWCGEIVENNTHVGWHGYKVTILIPIKMNPEALGGVGVDTNGEGSGIFIDGKNEFPFISPKVNLPVNIIINKQGLDEGESSKFTILRKTASDSNWEEVTSVFVTRHKGQDINAPRTRIEGLPATNKSGVEYIYKVREDDWSWSYTLTSDRELTTDDNDNPFTFTNSKKNRIDTKIRHAESKVTNTFKTGEGAAYDDSKSNGRAVITVETETEGEGGGTTTP